MSAEGAQARLKVQAVARDLRVLLADIEGVASPIRQLLAEIDPAVLPSHPVRVEEHREGTLRHWSDLPEVLAVHTLRHPDAGGGVFVTAGDRMQWRYDWCCLSLSEARRLGLALLAAAREAECDVSKHGDAR